MTNYENLQVRFLAGERILMGDGGNPPQLGETILIDGKRAEVIASRQELVNDTSTEGRFIAVYKP